MTMREDAAEAGANLAVRIDARLRAAPGRDALTWLERGERLGIVLTAGDLRSRAVALARRLQAEVAPGAQALLVMSPGPEFTVALLACLYAGVVAVPLPMPRPGAAGERLDAVVADASPQAVITTVADADALRALLPGLRLVAIAPPKRDDDLPATDPASTDGLPGLALAPDATVVVQYTSGSTRSPRGVTVSGANIAANGWRVADDWQVLATDSVLTWLPHYHDMGLMGSLLYPLLWGIPVVQMSPLAFVQKPVRWLKALQAWGATLSGGPAFAFALCLDTIAPEARAGFDLRGWRRAYCGAEPVPAALMQRFRDSFAVAGFDGDILFSTYGLAEATLFVAGRNRPPGAAAVSGDAAAPSGTEPCHLSAASMAAIRIVDPDSLQPVGEGASGEIWVSGASNSAGYLTQGQDDVFGLRLPGEPAAYMRTGDLGRLQGAVLHITGRRKDILIAHGANVAAADLEWLAAGQDDTLNPHAAAAFDLQRDGTGKVALLIEMRNGREAINDPVGLEKKIRAAVRSSFSLEINLLCFVKRGSLDRTSSGKIRRQTVAERVRAGYRYPSATME